MKKNVFSVFFLVFLIPVFAREFTLSDATGHPVIFYESKDGLEISVAARNILSERKVRYVVGIKNNGSDDFYFDEKSISVLQGDYGTDSWSYLNYYNASAYYAMKEAEYNATAVVAGVGLGLIFLDLLLDAIPSFHYSSHGYYAPSHPPRRFRTYDSLFATWLDVGISTAVISSLMDDFDYNPGHLKNALLFSKKIAPGESESGYFVADVGSGPDYKVRIDISKDEAAEFVFLRSDRKEILYPWSDPKTSRHSFSYGIFFPMEGYNFSANYIWGGQPVGSYLSFNAQIDGIADSRPLGEVNGSNLVVFTDEYYKDRYPKGSASFVPDGKSFSDVVGFTAGISVKTVPHTWLLVGCGIDVETLCLRGTIKDSSNAVIVENAWVYNSRGNVYAVPQVGFNAVFNFLNFGGTFSWRLGEGAKSGPLYGAFVGFSF